MLRFDRSNDDTSNDTLYGAIKKFISLLLAFAIAVIATAVASAYWFMAITVQDSCNNHEYTRVVFFEEQYNYSDEDKDKLGRFYNETPTHKSNEAGPFIFEGKNCWKDSVKWLEKNGYTSKATNGESDDMWDMHLDADYTHADMNTDDDTWLVKADGDVDHVLDYYVIFKSGRLGFRKYYIKTTGIIGVRPVDDENCHPLLVEWLLDPHNPAKNFNFHKNQPWLPKDYGLAQKMSSMANPNAP